MRTQRALSGAALPPEHLAESMLRESVGGRSYLLGAARRPQTVRVASTVAGGVPRTPLAPPLSAPGQARNGPASARGEFTRDS